MEELVMSPKEYKKLLDIAAIDYINMKRGEPTGDLEKYVIKRFGLKHPFPNGGYMVKVNFMEDVENENKP